MTDATAETGVERRGGAAGHDPWAHRKGEPRLLTVLWTGALLIATSSLLFIPAMTRLLDQHELRYNARILLLLIVVGVTVLWPMIRLSQALPRRPVLGALSDIAAIAGPAIIVILPLSRLADWSLPTMGALVTLVFSWAMLIGSLVALATATTTGHLWRGVWMLGFLALVAGAPLARAIFGSDAIPHGALMSPLTGVLALTETSGPTAVVASSPPAPRWEPLIWPGGLSAPLWVAAAVLSRVRTRRA